MEQLMASHIMENKRIPRKIKKALKYTFLISKSMWKMSQVWSGIYCRKKILKWTRKAAKKIRRYMDYAEMINMMTEQLKGIYAKQSKEKVMRTQTLAFFEWEVETNFINK